MYGGRFERSFLDVRVFNPYARSNSSSSIASVYRKHEQEKRRLYEARVREVEHASFIPVVYATSGGAGRSANALVKRIASRSHGREEVAALLTSDGLAEVEDQQLSRQSLYPVPARFKTS